MAPWLGQNEMNDREKKIQVRMWDFEIFDFHIAISFQKGLSHNHN